VARQPSIDTSPTNAQDVAAQIFVHCFPLVLADTVRRAHPMALHQVQFVLSHCEALAPGLTDDDDARVVTTSAWIDLAEGPAVLRLPNTHGRYFSVTLIDAAGEPFASLGSRTRDDVGVDIALAGPRWRGEVPGRLTARRAPSDGVWAVSRLHAHSAADRAEAEAIARRQGVALLQRESDQVQVATFGREVSARLEAPASPCVQQVLDMPPATFFHRLTHILDRAPAYYQQSARPAVEELRARIGGPGDSSEWSREFEQALGRGLIDGVAAIRAAAAQAPSGDTLGWRTIGTRLETAPPNALTRAARAFAGMGAAVRDDMLAFTCDQDEAGRRLSGAERYRIHFPSQATPPVEGFWWLSTRPPAVDDRRHGLGDRSDLTLNPDGSLDLIVQSTPPAVAQIPNWLPSPEGEFTLNMRLFWPRAPALDGEWRMPPVERLGSGFARRAGLRNPPPGTFHPPPADSQPPSPSARRMTP
jgi:hypothetical protein